MVEVSLRERLLKAGEHLFAREGFGSARLSDITSMAGARNDSAVQYYFGSREGLLFAILERHNNEVAEEVTRRVATLDTDVTREEALRQAIAVLAFPLSEQLKTESGCDYLVILAQVFETGGTSPPRPEYADIFGLVNSLIHKQLSDQPPALREERLHRLANFMVSSMASRARRLSRSEPMRISHEAFVANLIEMSVAASLAPVPKAAIPK